MGLPVFVVRKLEKEVKEKIKNKIYSEDELKSIYNSINTNMENAKLGFIYNAILYLLVFGFIAYKVISLNTRFSSIGLPFGVSCYLIVMIALYLNRTSAKRSFTKLVKANYPDIADKVLSE